MKLHTKNVLKTDRHTFIAVACAICLVCGCGNPKPKTNIESTVPQPGFADGWSSDSPMVFDKDSLFELIDGEAEIFFPFGFTEAISITYKKDGTDHTAISAEVYAMGSPADALGIYAKFKRTDTSAPKFAADGFSDDYQVIFCLNKYFVRLTALGKWDSSKTDLLACGAAIANLIS